MNPLPECCIPHSAPIPHQFVMKVYVDAWIYVTEKFVNMGNIELYEGVLRYEKADYPPIPNFICTHSPSIFLDFQGVSAFGVLAVTPFLHHFRIWLYWISSDYTILLKLLDGIIQRFGSHMNIPIHCCFDAGMTQQFLQHLGLHNAFDCTRCIGVAQCVHAEFFNSCFVA